MQIELIKIINHGYNLNRKLNDRVDKKIRQEF